MEIDKDKFCYYPFTQMLLQPTGNVTPCCWNQKYILGDNQKTAILDIWNGAEAQALRNEFLTGQPKSCQHQMKFIQCHRNSWRPEIDPIDLQAKMLHGPRRLDLRLNGKCNLQCIMCDVWKEPNGLFDQTDFWSTATDKIFPYLKEIDVLGGEPFVQKDTFRLIREISQSNPKCTWAFVTNGQYAFSGIVPHLDQIHLRWIQLSLDASTDETYQKVRKGGNFEKSLSTLRQLIDYREKRQKMNVPFWLSVSFCVQRENWHEIPGFLALCRSLNVHPIFQMLFEPSSLGILSLNISEKKKILKHIQSENQDLGLKEAIIDPLIASVVDTNFQNSPGV